MSGGLPRWFLIAACHLAVASFGLLLSLGSSRLGNGMLCAAAIFSGMAALWSRQRRHGLGVGQEHALFYFFPVSVWWYLIWEAKKSPDHSAILAALGLVATFIGAYGIGFGIRFLVYLVS